jgi:hypothetical protein
MSSASVWVNDGTGTFSINQDGLGGDEVFNPALGDLDGDGDLDIFFAAIGTNTVWINRGDGTYEDSGQRLATGIDAAVALGDLDSDGDLDALTGGWEGPAKTWLNDGTGFFTLGTHDMTRRDLHIHDLALADLNGDGDLDAFATLANRGPHQVWFNDGTGYFDTHQTLPAPLGHGVALGDLDGDGDIDAVTAHGAPTGGYLKIWLNDGSGTFTDSQLTLGEGFCSAVALGDLDADGDLDIFSAHTRWNHQGEGEPDKVWLNLE